MSDPPDRIVDMATSDRDGLPRFQAETRAQWRQWLTRHHADGTGVWVISWRKETGKPYVTYDEIVEEALCFGWIDSVGNKLDDERHMLRISPRKKGSAWSRVNKQRIAQLEKAGLIEPAGWAAIERAKADGTWSALDEVEDLVEPKDLASALDQVADARTNWDAFPPSARKGILWWIVSAKRPETRAKRIDETATLAAQNIRANFPRQ